MARAPQGEQPVYNRVAVTITRRPLDWVEPIARNSMRDNWLHLRYEETRRPVAFERRATVLPAFEPAHSQRLQVPRSARNLHVS